MGEVAAGDNSLQTTLRKYWGDEILNLEVINVILKLYNSAQHEIIESGLPAWVLPMSMMFTTFLLVTLILKHCCSRGVVRKSSEKVKAAKEFIAPSEGPRFRKRDKIAFMGRKVYKNAKVWIDFSDIAIFLK